MVLRDFFFLSKGGFDFFFFKEGSAGVDEWLRSDTVFFLKFDLKKNIFF